MESLPYKHIKLNETPLKPEDILELRNKYYRENIFFEDPVYQNIKDSISDNNITLITGNPLSGKTRIVYDSLKLNRIYNLIIPKKDKSINKIYIPQEIKDIVVFFDDIDDYCFEGNNALNSLLKYIINQNIKCIITCRKGPEFYKLKTHLKPDIFNIICENRFDIPKFNKDKLEVKNFLEFNKTLFKSEISHFDGNFGSVLLPLKAMRERFELLNNDEKNYIEVGILLGLKLHFHLRNYESSKHEYNDLKIKHFTQKYVSEQFSLYQWEQAKNNLIANDTALNFIQVKENLVIEEAYLDFLKNEKNDSIDVVHPDFNLYRLKTTLDSLYTFEEKKVWGFPSNIYDYNKLIKGVESFEEAIEIYNNFPSNVKPDSFTFGYIFSKTNDVILLKKYYKEMLSKKAFHIKSADIFAGKLNNFIQFIELFEDIDPIRIRSLNGVSNKLIKLSKVNPKESLFYLFEKYKILDIFKNPVFNEVCRVCCIDEQDFINYIQPNIEILDYIDKPMQLNFIKTFTKLKKDGSTELIEKYLDKNTFDYLNETANSISDINYEKSLNLYKEALDITSNKIEKVIAITNFCNLVFYKKIEEKYDEALQLANIRILAEENIFPAKYLKEVSLLIQIHKTPKDLLIDHIDDLIRKDLFSLKKIKNIISKIEDEEKKQILKIKYLNSILTDDSSEI